MSNTNNSFCPTKAGGMGGYNNSMHRKPIIENYGYPCNHEIIVRRVSGGTANICVDSAETVQNFETYKTTFNIRYDGADTGGQLKCDRDFSIPCNYTSKKGELHNATSGDKQGNHIYRGNGGRYNISTSGIGGFHINIS